MQSRIRQIADEVATGVSETPVSLLADELDGLQARMESEATRMDGEEARQARRLASSVGELHRAVRGADEAAVHRAVSRVEHAANLLRC